MYLNALPLNHADLSDEEIRGHVDQYLSQVFLKEMAGTKDLLDQRVIKAMELADRNLGRKLLLEEVAGHICLSPDRTRHFFIEQTGIPFSQYLLWKRIRGIASAVYTEQISAAEACLHYGFTDYPHFSRIFKRMFGVSPMWS